jgi:hypothetical protein
MAETPEERLDRLRREVEAEERALAASQPAAPPTPAAASHPPSTSAATASAPIPAVATAPSPSTGEGWSLSATLDELGAGRILAIGLIVVGAYLLAVQFFPFLSIAGSLAILVVGIVVLAMHFQARAGAWALYVGAVLTAVGGARLIGGLPFVPSRGLVSIAIGVAFLAISYLRHSQAGGYGWQAVVGVVFLAWGAIQFVLGLIPGSPGFLELVVPLVLLGGGAYLLLRALQRPSGKGVSP